MAWKMVSRLGVTRIVVTLGVLACAMLALGRTTSGTDPEAHETAQAVLLTSGSGFDLFGAVGDLAPGIASRLMLQVANPNTFAITLRTVRISVSSEPAGCPAANLTITGQAFSGSPPAITVTGLTMVIPAHQTATLPLAILLDRSAGNGCQDVMFQFRYLGTAAGVTSATRLPTATTLASSPNPSRAGRPVTLMAAVLAASPAAGGAKPSGWVTFWRCYKPAHLRSRSLASACSSAVPAGRPEPLTAGVGRLVLRPLTAGSYVYFASFSPAGIQFARSRSRTITQTVLCPRQHPRCWRGKPR